MSRCECTAEHAPRLVAVTGGPGAGKTTLVDVVKRNFCEHITVLPESATILYSGGFPRHATGPGKLAAQRAIFAVQRQLERMALEERRAAVVLCDRGTLDGLAYWPEAPGSFFQEMGTSEEAELARYHAVIHLRTPNSEAYDQTNPIRIENVEQARALDEAVLRVWSRHPCRTVIDGTTSFIDKVARAVVAVHQEVPACCQRQR